MISQVLLSSEETAADELASLMSPWSAALSLSLSFSLNHKTVYIKSGLTKTITTVHWFDNNAF